MSTPEERHPIDPLSQALGRIEGKLDGLEKHLGERFTAVEARFAGVDKRIDDLRATLFWGLGITWALVVASGVLARLLH
jgi:hypothetical protein